jgi:hypothetical protein
MCTESIDLVHSRSLGDGLVRNYRSIQLHKNLLALQVQRATGDLLQ